MTRKFKKHTFRKSYRHKARWNRTTLKRTIQRVLNRNTETKFFNVSVENAQLYHNVGYNATVPVAGALPHSDSTFFNPWSDIPPGTGRANRIGDKIKPLSMNIKV